MSKSLPTIRPARDDDADGLIALIDGCFREYPGCITDVDGEMPELNAIASYAKEYDGRFWVAERDGAVVGSVCAVPAAEQGMELFKLYVNASERGAGLGRVLIGLVEAEAVNRGAAFVELWSDTRFANAHRLYELLGYIRGPMTRALADKSHSVEFYYRKTL